MTLKSLVNIILGFINQISAILVGVIILVFIGKIIQNLLKSNQAEGRQKLTKVMLFGIIAIFFALSFFTIAGLIKNDLGI